MSGWLRQIACILMIRGRKASRTATRGATRRPTGPVSTARVEYVQRQLSTESPGLARHGEASPLQLAQPRAGPLQRRLWTPVGR
jgi:hypothetical protein